MRRRRSSRAAQPLLSVPLAILLAACGGDASTGTGIEPPPPLGGTAAEIAAAGAAVEDAAARLVPALGAADGATELGAALQALSGDVARRDRESVAERLASVRQALDALESTVEPGLAPELSAIRLVVLELERLLAAPAPT